MRPSVAKAPTRAVIYTRVSNDPRGERRSVTEQEDECRAVCDREGWDVVEVLTDNDKSAYGKKARPAYNALLDLLSAGSADVLVIWEASRAQRKLSDYVRLRELCQEKNVLWNYSGQTYDLSTTDGRYDTGKDALDSEHESDRTSDRIKRSVRGGIANGRPHGKRPFGYAREYDPQTRKLLAQVIREDQAEIVREIARRLLARESCYAIAQDFNARGVSTPTGKGTWGLKQVKRYAVSPTYISKRVHNGVVQAVDGNWPPILDAKTHYQLVALLDDPARKSVRDGSVKHLLSGIACCGVCGQRLGVLKPHAVVQYQCKAAHCVARKVEWVDALVVELVIARLSQPDAAQMFIEGSGDEEVEKTLALIAEEEARLQTFYDAAAEGELQPAGLARIEATILSKIAALRKRIKKIELPTTVYELAKNPAAVWEGLSIVQRREIIRVLVDVKVNLSTTTRGSRKFNPADIEVTWKQDTTQAV